jgi:hypothetical protein
MSLEQPIHWCVGHKGMSAQPAKYDRPNTRFTRKSIASSFQSRNEQEWSS